MTPPDDPLRAALHALRDLPDDWDSYGAKPLDGHVLDLADRIAALLPSLQAVPGSDGSISFEAHRGDDTISLSVEPDGHTALFTLLDGYETDTDAALQQPARSEGLICGDCGERIALAVPGETE